MAPRLKLGCFGVRLEVVESRYVVAQDIPEGVGDDTSDSSTVEKAADTEVAV